MSKEPRVGDRVTLAYPTKMTYGYVRAIGQVDGSRGPLHVYFPQIRSTGTGWFAYDFKEYQEEERGV